METLTIQTLLQTLFPEKEKAWMDLLTITGIIQLHDFCAQGTAHELLESLNICLQRTWLRPSGKERWDIVDDHLSASQKKEMDRIFNELALYQAIAPTQQNYDAVILM